MSAGLFSFSRAFGLFFTRWFSCCMRINDGLSQAIQTQIPTLYIVITTTAYKLYHFKDKRSVIDYSSCMTSRSQIRATSLFGRLFASKFVLRRKREPRRYWPRNMWKACQYEYMRTNITRLRPAYESLSIANIICGFNQHFHFGTMVDLLWA